ncbi:ribosomal protein subunit S23 [Schizosaccharomyces cryophilus OY26]|uniref:Small ribosomal subunit protein mS29 n=1 Tax=Schizosaccharomyces cryophilus (strain OY26 / ATCC MYA-4695 / CBS 11777 / NBRC 106824 / NRRL Y48691) TaxID=653667 RepID=S9VU40_SCHCR|nr:ribosomal protein subunit S23 [Schizosaccharomyces cryophilus OY26]EPY49625.1 ribosomal protein subunit S23 [Schizosaccharomyces cryophilus OY26]
MLPKLRSTANSLNIRAGLLGRSKFTWKYRVRNYTYKVERTNSNCSRGIHRFSTFSPLNNKINNPQHQRNSGNLRSNGKKGSQSIESKDSDNMNKKSSLRGQESSNGSIVLDELINQDNQQVKEKPSQAIHKTLDWSPKAEGKMYEIPNSLLGKLETLGALEKQKKSFSFFSNPVLLHRKVTTKLYNILQRSKNVSSASGRYVLDGSAGSGRSISLLQAEIFAFSHPNYVVLGLHNCERWVDSSSPYSYDASLQSWVQPELIKEFLTSVMNVNSKALGTLTTSKSYELVPGKSIPAGTDLHTLLRKITSKSELSVRFCQSFLQELDAATKQPNSSVNVLFVIDNLSVLSVPTKYKNTENHNLLPCDFYFINILYQYLSGSLSFHRGTIFAATSSQPRIQTPSLDVALGKAKLDPYIPINKAIYDSTKSLQVIPMEPYSVDESLSVMEHLVTSNVCLESVESHRQNHVLSGGNPRLFFDTCTRLT